jgi:hypothetical protein
MQIKHDKPVLKCGPLRLRLIRFKPTASEQDAAKPLQEVGGNGLRAVAAEKWVGKVQQQPAFSGINH